jgi:hypothetical protein
MLETKQLTVAIEGKEIMQDVRLGEKGSVNAMRETLKAC